MKTCHLVAFPALVWSQDETLLLSTSLIEDDPVLLSVKMKMKASLESGVDHFLETVGTRNVTQMSSLLQNLVEETISEGSNEQSVLAGEVETALQMIKDALLGDIRGALKDAHCFDQVELNQQMSCFEGCDKARVEGSKSCEDRGEVDRVCNAHKQCRNSLLPLYTDHIKACRKLDDIPGLSCPEGPDKKCLLGHSTWNCRDCSADSNCEVSVELKGNQPGGYGHWINQQLNKFKAAHSSWVKLNKACSEAYSAYVRKDAECDCHQSECEVLNCDYEVCHSDNCDKTYNACWKHCEETLDDVHKAKECLEKDRKIDWSATEKIECYVNVLLEKPSNETLFKQCGAVDCFNTYREMMYKNCSLICPEVDFDGEMGKHDKRHHVNHTVRDGHNIEVKDQDTHNHQDIDVTKKGSDHIHTKHRGNVCKDHHDVGSDEFAKCKGEKRCTSHLDLDYQPAPCCKPCASRPSPPCEAGDNSKYMQAQYGDFISKATIPGLPSKTCHDDENTYEYAYNLCPCINCGADKYPDQTCTNTKACAAGHDYDYRQHDVKDDACGTTVTTTPMALPSTNCPSPAHARTCHYYQDPHISHTFFSNYQVSANSKRYSQGGYVFSFVPSGVFSVADSADGFFEVQSFFCPLGGSPSVGGGVAARFGTDVIQVIKGKGSGTVSSPGHNQYTGLSGPEVNYTDFFMNGKEVFWEELGDGKKGPHSHKWTRGDGVIGTGGLTTGNAYLQKMKPTHSAYYTVLPVCMGDNRDSIVEVAMSGWSIFNQRVTIRTSKPGNAGQSICNLPHGQKLSKAESENYRVRGKDLLFTTEQMHQLCTMCGLPMKQVDGKDSCEAPGVSASPEEICKEFDMSFTEAKTHCKDFATQSDWFDACVIEYCVALDVEGDSAVAIAKTEKKIQDELNYLDKMEAEGKELVNEKWW